MRIPKKCVLTPVSTRPLSKSDIFMRAFRLLPFLTNVPQNIYAL